MNVLITSVSRKVSLVRAFQDALRIEGGDKVVAVDVDPHAPALYLADDHYLVPKSAAPDFLSEMLRLCARLHVKLLVPTRDEELPFFAKHKDKFTDIGTQVMVSSLSTITTCQDKKLFIEFCAQEGLIVPKVYNHLDLPANLEFALFIKPRFGKGGSFATCVESSGELKRALREVPDPIIQEFIKAPEYTIDLFSDFSSQVISVVPRERIRVFGGESFVGKTVANPNLIKESIRLATSLELIGHNTIQCFLHNDVVKFIEVNPRFGGGAHLGFAAGAPTPHFLVRLLKGEPLEPRIGDFMASYVMLRYTEDIFLEAERLTEKCLK